VTYHGQYFTINSRISECDHQCETRNAEPEIGTDGSSQTRRNPWVDGYGSGFGLPRVCGSGFGRFKNRTDLFLRSKPGPLVGYLDPLLTLSQMLNRSRVVKWLTVVQHPILEFDKYTGNEYILIISEHKSTNFGSPVLFNLSAE